MEDYIILEGKIKYILSSCPSKSNIEQYSTFLKNNNVKYLVNLCDSHYPIDHLDNSINYVNIPIDDGKNPEENQLEEWKRLCQNCINENKNIALHCLSGMGRAPTMLCISLIEYENYLPCDAIELLREKRKNCINTLQLRYIINYKADKKNINCSIM